MQRSTLTRVQPILVTGGAGFIGSNFVLDWFRSDDAPLVVLDALTYAGLLSNLESVKHERRCVVVQGDICDTGLVQRLLTEHMPRAVVHFAAETHVDRSVLDPRAFLRTNIDGTASLLEAVRAHLAQRPASERDEFRFLHVSTDEVYGTLAPDAAAFTETTAYAPNSPYAASKAASDMLVRAWHHTYGLPTLITNCSNNYGPFQFPEKLIPLVITEALAGQPLPIYGDGQQVRDWLYVQDHTAAVRQVLACGVPGETYNIGGDNQKTNLEVVEEICTLLDELAPDAGGRSHSRLIRFVADRPGHDRRYAINAEKIRTNLQWTPRHSFTEGLRATVQWYLSHNAWVEQTRAGSHRKWMAQNYNGRLELAKPSHSASVHAVEER